MHKLAQTAWDIHRAAEGLNYVAAKSMPILYFGDQQAYERSGLRVITVGLNPSHIEFPQVNHHARFPLAKELANKTVTKDDLDIYVKSLNRYFAVDPYHAWFNTFKGLLEGFECSFYPSATNTAIHTDICSPLATNPTWSKLSEHQRGQLEADGVELWHRLVERLQPDIILISVARRHLNKVRFTPLSDLLPIHTLHRKNPYQFEHQRFEIAGKPTHMIFGKAAQTPFGTVSNEDKTNIGKNIARLLGVDCRA